METYNISTTAGYKGCGEAFGLIQNDVVTQLTYVDSLLSLEDWDN